jgi:hypothetical protein
VKKRRSSKRIRFAAATGALAAATPVIVAPVHASPAAGGITPAGVTFLIDSKVDEQVAGDLDLALSRLAPDSFGGVLVDYKLRTVTVYASVRLGKDDVRRMMMGLVARVDSFERVGNIRVGGLVADMSVVVNFQDRTYADYSAQAIELTRKYSDITQYYTDYASRELRVGVVASASAKVRGDIEASDVTKRVKTFVVYGEDHTVARQNDGPPHFAGSRFRSPGGNTCTTAFAVTNTKSGARGMLTAGHCSVSSDLNSGSWTGPGGSDFGVMRGRNNGGCQTDTAPCHDDSYVNGSTYNSYMYDGGPTSNTALLVNGAMTPQFLSTNVYVSGAQTSANGGQGRYGPFQTVIQAPKCKQINDGGVLTWYCGLMEMDAIVTPTAFPVGGDSGGAVYTYAVSPFNSPVRAVGILTAVGGVISYTPISTALADFGLSLL